MAEPHLPRHRGSVAPDLAERLRPRGAQLEQNWSHVSDDDRRAAVAEARGNAVDRLIRAARPVPVLVGRASSAESTGSDEGSQETPGEPPAGRPDTDADREAVRLTLGDVFSTGTVEAETRQWLYERPITRVRFEEDRRVEVKLALEPSEWVEQLRVSMADLDAGFPALADEDWAELTVRLEEVLPSEATGQAVATESVPGPAADLSLPEVPPAWARTPITTQGTAVAGPSRLLTARAAEKVARDELREQLRSLPVGEDETLGDLADENQAVADLLETAVTQAKRTNASYSSDGSARVQVSLDGRALWQSLRR